MEAEKAEVSRRFNNSFRNILLVVEVAAVVALLGYRCFPAIVIILQEVTVWFDWLRLVLSNLFIVFMIVNALVVLIYVSRKPIGKNNPDLYDQYLAAVPTVIRASPFDNYDIMKAGDVEYNILNNREIVPAFRAVKTIEESNCTYDGEVVEESSKSYRRTRSEKKTEYRRTESERVTKTASWRSQTIDGLSNEEFRMTVETFIMEKKKTLLRDNGVVHQWQNGVVDQWQNDVGKERQIGVSECQNGIVQWQGSRENGSGRHRGRSHRLVGGSGSNGSGSYLAISN